ncbi:MAG: hypothetical protein IJM31_08475 [Campylobacter sp.]|nr:hypothetical protein [Campylobacter sp.]
MVSQNGGHLSSNLGTVEATIALLKVFGEKKNAIIWDVGHQCYAYKILTGRKDKIHSIRKKSGLSGLQIMKSQVMINLNPVTVEIPYLWRWAFQNLSLILKKTAK